jgi:putative DNA primase/helicase
MASSTDPASWSSFAIVAEAAARNGWGIGFVFNGDGLVGIDLDDCRDPETGTLAQWASEIIEGLQSYCEVSPSQTGVKLFVRGALPDRFSKQHKRPDGLGHVEIYCTGRFFTVTGQKLSVSPDVVSNRSEQLSTLLANLNSWKTVTKREVETVSTATNDDSTTALAALAVLDPGMNYEAWLTVGMALHSVDQSSQMLTEWVEWSRKSDKFVEGECESKWRSFSGNGIGIGSLCMLADQTMRTWRPARQNRESGSTHPPSENDWTSLRRPEGRTDLANARRLIAAHGDKMRFCHPWSKWLNWDGARWNVNDDGAPERLAAAVSDSIWSEAKKHIGNPEIIRFAIKSAGQLPISAMLKLAAAHLPIAVADMDANPWLLNCPNGTIDLRTGNCRPCRREDNLTKLCPTKFNPDASSYAWDRFLEGIFAGDDLIIRFLQRLCGYFLTGIVSEQLLVFFHGSGSNGKSTLLGAIQGTIGPDYSTAGPAGLLMEKKSDSHPTELAGLFGRRLVVAQETSAGARLAEATVKQLTGGDLISARRMREDFWSFTPTHKLVISSNHKPKIRGTDHAIWRRLALVPFEQKFWNPAKGESGPDELRQDKDLPAKLTTEAEGILAWMVEGCLEWQRRGLDVPASVRAATEEYQTEEDVIGRFVSDCCLTGRVYKVKFSNLYEAFEGWCNESGDNVASRRFFGQWLKDNGYRDQKSSCRWYEGIGLKNEF